MEVRTSRENRSRSFVSRRAPSAADDVAVVDGPADQGPGASTEDCAQRLRAAGSDDVAQHRTAHTTDNQARGAIVASAVVAVVRTPVNAIVSAQTSRTVSGDRHVCNTVPDPSNRCVTRSDRPGDPIGLPDDLDGFPGDPAGFRPRSRRSSRRSQRSSYRSRRSLPFACSRRWQHADE